MTREKLLDVIYLNHQPYILYTFQIQMYKEKKIKYEHMIFTKFYMN